jgi:actin-like ATPase involved in cell morphogenesis
LAEKENILPGGITLVGGGSKLWNIEKILKEKLTIPIKKPLSSLSDNATDYHSAYGNVIIGLKDNYNQPIKIKNILSSVKKLLKKFSI